MVGDGQAISLVRVQPNASQNKVLRFEDGILHLRIAVLPVRGKANQELLKFLSDILRVSKSNLTITKGLTSNKKVIGINHLTRNQVVERLEQLRRRGREISECTCEKETSKIEPMK